MSTMRITGPTLGSLGVNPQMAESYVLWVSGATYYAKNGSTGEITTGSVFSTLINTCITALPTALDSGRIFLKAGTYTVTSAIALGEQTRLIGEGADATVLSVDAPVNCIEIRSCSGDVAAWEISSLTIDMNDNTGHGIYASYAHNSDLVYCGMHNLYIYGILSGYIGIYLKEPMNLRLDSIRIRTAGTGIKLEVLSTPAINWGNSFLSEIRVGLTANDAVGFDFAGYDSTHLLNLMNCQRLQVVATTYTGTIGIRLVYVYWSDFYNLDIEDAKTGLDIQNCLGLTFNGGYVGKGEDDMTYAVYLKHYSRHITFNSMKIEAGTGTDVYSVTTNRLGSVTFSNMHSSALPILSITPNEDVKNWYQLSTTLGNVTNPFTNTVFNIESSNRATIRPLGGEAAAPTASIDYVVVNMPVYVTSTGGTGVSITVKSQDGDTIASGLTTLTGYYLAPLTRLNFGAFSVAPTVVVSAVGNW